MAWEETCVINSWCKANWHENQNKKILPSDFYLDLKFILYPKPHFIWYLYTSKLLAKEFPHFITVPEFRVQQNSNCVVDGDQEKYSGGPNQRLEQTNDVAKPINILGKTIIQKKKKGRLSGTGFYLSNHVLFIQSHYLAKGSSSDQKLAIERESFHQKGESFQIFIFKKKKKYFVSRIRLVKWRHALFRDKW